MRQEKRVATLESRSPTTMAEAHIVGRTKEFATDDEALDAYGRHHIGPDDMVIMLVPISPEREEESRRARLAAPDEPSQP